MAAKISGVDKGDVPINNTRYIDVHVQQLIKVVPFAAAYSRLDNTSANVHAKATRLVAGDQGSSNLLNMKNSCQVLKDLGLQRKGTANQGGKLI